MVAIGPRRQLTSIERMAREFDALDERLVDKVAHTICRFANKICPCADRKRDPGCCESIRSTAQAIVLTVRRHG